MMKTVVSLTFATGLLVGSSIGAIAQDSVAGADEGSVSRAKLTVACSNLTKSKVKLNDVLDTAGSNTTSITFIDLPGTSVSFTQGGTGPGCVIVTFSAIGRADADDVSNVRVMMGQTAAKPNEIRFNAGTAGKYAAATYQFIFPLVPPGDRKIRIQYRSEDGNLVYLSNPFVRVDYR